MIILVIHFFLLFYDHVFRYVFHIWWAPLVSFCWIVDFTKFHKIEKVWALSWDTLWFSNFPNFHQIFVTSMFSKLANDSQENMTEIRKKGIENLFVILWLSCSSNHSSKIWLGSWEKKTVDIKIYHRKLIFFLRFLHDTKLCCYFYLFFMFRKF